jgi:broad specificity phosphatase PhoE
LYLVRHAESEGNAEQIMQGAGEYPLSRNGRDQAQRAAESLQRLSPTLVVASDLGRAQETALLTLGHIDIVEPRLRERGAGRWEGWSRLELEAAYPGALIDDELRPDGFEAKAEVVLRMRGAVRDLLDRPGTTVAFTHGAVLRLLEKDLGGAGVRFGHLEALVLGPGPVLLGRVNFLPVEVLP